MVYDRDMALLYHVLEVLTPEQCAQVTHTVDDLQSLWIQRSGALSTLGVGAYLDSPHPWNLRHSGITVDVQRGYFERAQHLNPVLISRFDWLYEIVKTALAKLLNKPVALSAGKALPGFHIFHSDPIYESSRGHAHVDRPYAGLDWSDFKEVDFRSSISFTLPISLPTAGGCLRFWELDLFEAGIWPAEIVEERLREALSWVHRYTPGRLLLHSGHALHRIEPWPYVQGERRLTLQGHGLYCDGVWQIYW